MVAASPPAVLRRNRAGRLVPSVAEAGTATVRALAPLAMAALLAICSPASAKSPSLFQSTQAFSLPPVPVTVAVTAPFSPAYRAPKETPSSSSVLFASSPVAAAVGMPLVSASRAVPSTSEPLIVCRGALAATPPPVVLYATGRSPKS